MVTADRMDLTWLSSALDERKVETGMGVEEGWRVKDGDDCEDENREDEAIGRRWRGKRR